MTILSFLVQTQIYQLARITIPELINSHKINIDALILTYAHIYIKMAKSSSVADHVFYEEKELLKKLR